MHTQRKLRSGRYLGMAGLAAATVVAAALASPAAATAKAGEKAPPRSATVSDTARTLGGQKVSTAAKAATAAGYWTKARMAKATPVDIPDAAASAAAKSAPLQANGSPRLVKPAAASGYRAAVNASATVGRVFFYNPTGTSMVTAGWHSCSASTVNSGSKQLVITAGHCIHGGAGGATYQNWTFYPGYYNGNAPYGSFAAKYVWIFSSWATSSDLTRDVGYVVTWPNNLGKVVNVVGGNGLAVNYPKTVYVTALAYPADPPYNGSTQQYCTGTTSNAGSTIGLRCGFTGGASGGPWLKDYNGALGNVNGVMSTLSTTGWNYSPYFDTAVYNLYNDMANVT